MLDKSEVGRRGYLSEDYRLFHLRDNREVKLDYHYHEFDKIVLQLSGRVTYNIEGKSYLLQPMDILLVSRNLIHLPVIDTREVYERMILWISRDFLGQLPKWEGDDIFLRLLWQDAPFFLLTLRYDHGRLQEAVLDGKKMQKTQNGVWTLPLDL